MQPLDLNLATRPFKNDTLPWVGLITAVVGLTVLTVWNIRTYRSNAHLSKDLSRQYAATREEMSEFDGRERVAQRNIEGFNLDALTVRADKANEVIRWKAFSWTQLFNLLQEVLPNDVQMVSIRPVFRPQAGSRRDESRPEQGRVPVSVEGTSKTLDAFFELERALLAHPNFENVDPEGHTQDRSRSVSFQLKFMYDPNPVIKVVEEVAPVEGDPADAGEAQAGKPTETAAAEAEPPDTAPLPDQEAPLATGAEMPELTRDAGIPPELADDRGIPPDSTGDDALPPEPGQAVEATEAEADATPKKPGRRKSGKRRSGSGRGTEGDK